MTKDNRRLQMAKKCEQNDLCAMSKSLSELNLDDVRLIREIMRQGALPGKIYIPMQPTWDRFARLSAENQK
jgi:hypothetical protein